MKHIISYYLPNCKFPLAIDYTSNLKMEKV